MYFIYRSCLIMSAEFVKIGFLFQLRLYYSCTPSTRDGIIKKRKVGQKDFFTDQ